MNRHNALVYPARKISVHHCPLIFRGASSLKPKKFSSKKLTNCLYDSLSIDLEEKVQSVKFLVGEGIDPVGRDFGVLASRGVFIEKQIVSLENFIGWLNSIGDSEACFMLGEERFSQSSSVSRLAEIGGYFSQSEDREIFLDLLKNSQTRLGDKLTFNSSNEHRPIILQDRPGKLSVLDLTEATQQYFEKEWYKKLLSRKIDSSFQGWGVGAALASGDPQKYDHPVCFAAQINSYSYSKMDLSWDEEVVSQFGTWCQSELGHGVDRFDGIIISTSSYLLAQKLQAAFNSDDENRYGKFIFPEFNLGFGSSFSALSMLSLNEGAFGMIALESPERSIFMASWV